MRVFFRTVVLAGLILLAALWGWRHFTYEITNANPAGVNVIAFGDSLTSGYGVPEKDCYVRLLEQRFDIRILNAGVTGDTSADALSRLQTAVLDRNPRIVIVLLGGNDLLERQPLENTVRNLETMITRIHEKGAAVVLVGVGSFLGGNLPAEVKKLARKYKTACVPNVLKGLLDNVNYMLPDRIHPNSAGHRIMAQRIGDEMERRLPAVFGR